MKNSKIYFDYNATHPLRDGVLEAMLPYLTGEFGNPASSHSFGQAARAAVDSARSEVASLLGARLNEVVFTSGGTEANNLAILGGAKLNRNKSHIVAGAIEHSSVINTCKALEANGAVVSWVKPNSSGIINVEAVVEQVKPDTGLVTVMMANNETGAVQPVKEIAAVTRQCGCHFHVDAVQALGRMKVDVGEIGADSVSVSAHKIGAPKGVGALYCRTGVKLPAMMHGGAREQRLRPGTENVPAIVGFGAACHILRQKMANDIAHMAGLRKQLLAALHESCPGSVRINSPADHCLPNTVNLSCPGVEGEFMVVRLDMAGIAVSAGAACASGSQQPSHVLRAMGLEPEIALSGVRVSFGVETTAADIQQLVDALVGIIKTELT